MIRLDLVNKKGLKTMFTKSSLGGIYPKSKHAARLFRLVIERWPFAIFYEKQVKFTLSHIFLGFKLTLDEDLTYNYLFK